MTVFQLAKNFRSKFPLTIAWRLRANSSIVEKHLNPGETIKYLFVGQKNARFYDVFSTAIVAITNERIVIGRKRVIFGYYFDSVMPYMYNDLNIKAGLIWGKIKLDTLKEEVVITNVDKAALPEVETNISTNMMRLKKKYGKGKNEE